MAKNREEGVPESVEQHDECIQPSEWSQGARIARGQRRESEANENGSQQSQEPFAKLKDWHGEPSPAFAHGGDRRVIHAEESGGGLIEDVAREGDREREPGLAKSVGRRFRLHVRHYLAKRKKSIPEKNAAPDASVRWSSFLRQRCARGARFRFAWTPFDFAQGRSKGLSLRKQESTLFYFAHQAQQIAFRIAEEGHPQIVIGHSGDEVRLVVKLHALVLHDGVGGLNVGNGKIQN